MLFGAVRVWELSMKLLLVGQGPSRSHGKKRAFDGPSGDRLARCLNTNRADLLSLIDTVNVLDRWPGKHGGLYAYRDKGDRFPIALARKRAAALESSPVFRNRPVVIFVGSRTAHAFGYGYELTFFQWFERADDHGFGLGLIIPHPSGCNLLWNDVEIWWRVGDYLRDALKIAAARLPRKDRS
jgi:uracil-DNA glycosylase